MVEDINRNIDMFTVQIPLARVIYKAAKLDSSATINSKPRYVKLLTSLPQNVFNIAVLNIIWAMVAAKRYDYDDPVIKELLMMVTDVTASLAPTPSLGFLGRHDHFPQHLCLNECDIQHNFKIDAGKDSNGK